MKNCLIKYNFAILLINIYIYIFINNNKSLILKSSDLYIFLQNHFKNKTLINQKKYENKSQKLKLKIACKDTLNNENCFQNSKKKLERLNYIVENNDDNPDFIIYDVFGCQHAQKKYNKSVKIALYSENIIPDFSEADYSLGQAHIIYMDRFFKYPSFIYRLNLFRKYNVTNIESFAKNKLKSKFCGAVISNHRNFSIFRLDFIKKLSEYKKVDMGGKYGNNIGKSVKNKIEFLSNYKFSISMENSNGDGYKVIFLFSYFYKIKIKFKI